MLANGFHDIPAGAIATVVTSLSMDSLPTLRPDVADPAWRFARVAVPEPEAYRRLYRAVGEDWLWFSRLLLDDAALGAIIGDPQVEVYHLTTDTGGEALLELDFRTPGACELAFLGLSAPLVGGPAGRWLMNRAIERAWSQPIDRFWVHTCSLDHPRALDFYRRSGFVPFARQVEVFADPRLTGVVRRDAAGHVPVFAA
jgi:GNAT superfamily N-acetyltransferase